MSPTSLPAHESGSRRAEARHQVIFVREQDAQHSGSGCCGRLGEAHSALGKAADFSHSRARMEHVGEIYRALAEAAPELDLVVADPRNYLWLYSVVWRAARAHGLSALASLQSMSRAGAPVAVVFDGQTLFWGRLPETDVAVDTILERLQQRFEA